jgi:hypothetical protein
LEGKFNKKTDIWAMGCLLYELLNGTKVFGTDWAVISWAQSPQPKSHLPLGIAPLNVEQASVPWAERIISIYHLMLQLDAEQRCGTHQLCARINSFSKIGAPYTLGNSTVFLEPSQLIGTEVPVPTYFNLATYDQILPRTARYSDFQLLVERRKAIAKRRESTLGSQNLFTIWAYIYLAYTHHCLGENDLALQTLLGHALLCSHGLRFDQSSRPDFHVASMFAFCQISRHPDGEAVQTMQEEMRRLVFHGELELDPVDRLRLDHCGVEGLVNLPCSPERSLSWALDLDLVTRLTREENVGAEHVLTILAQCYIGILCHRGLRWDMGSFAISTAVSTARKILPSDSRDRLVVESFWASVAFGFMNFDNEKIVISICRSMVVLLPRLIEAFGKKVSCTQRTIEGIRQGRQVLGHLVDTEETRTLLADLQELMDAFGL